MLKSINLDKISEPYRTRVKKYVQILYDNFYEDFIGLIVFGSVARGEAKVDLKYESDLDVLAVIENLPDRFSIERLQLEAKIEPVYSVVSKLVTKSELQSYFKAKSGFILDAFDDGIIVYDPYEYLSIKRKELFEELNQKGVIRKKNLGWVFPVKAGEKIEY